MDYSKIIIINEPKYIESKSSIIDKDEFLKTKKYITIIKNQAIKYVDTYVKHCNGISVLDEEEFQRKYKMSTLPYFHKQLGIVEQEN